MAALSPRRALGVLCACAALVSAARAADPPLGEYDLKALFIFNFTQFVEWPAAAFAGPDAPLCIGVLGDDPFGGALERTVDGERIQNRPLAVQRARSAAELRGCQLVFIARSERERLPEVLGELGGQATLTVSEIEGFAQRGGVIGFFLQDNRVRFEISPRAAQRAELRISSQLLSLGRLVEPAAGDS